jgi:hypothetical protein
MEPDERQHLCPFHQRAPAGKTFPSFQLHSWRLMSGATVSEMIRIVLSDCLDQKHMEERTVLFRDAILAAASQAGVNLDTEVGSWGPVLGRSWRPGGLAGPDPAPSRLFPFSCRQSPPFTDILSGKGRTVRRGRQIELTVNFCAALVAVV